MNQDNYTSEHEDDNEEIQDEHNQIDDQDDQDEVEESEEQEEQEEREERSERNERSDRGDRGRGGRGRRERDPIIEDIIHELIGSSIEVHKALGPGLDAKAYTTALDIELDEREMPMERDATADVFYKETKVAEGSVDFILDEKLPVGILSVEKLLPVHNAQMLAYLRATDTKVGMLINFNAHLLKEGLRRIVL